MDKKLFKKFVTEKVAVHLETSAECKAFMKLLEKETDVTWARGERPTEHYNFWWVYDNNTCVDYCGNLMFSPKKIYEDCGYKIIDFQDLIKEEEN